MSYKVTSLLNDDVKKFVTNLKDNNISFCENSQFSKTDRKLLFDLEYEGTYKGYIYNFGDRFYFENEADITLLEIFNKKLELSDPINVFNISENGILMEDIQYTNLFELQIGDVYYELEKNVWVKHIEKYNPGFNLYNSFKWFDKMKKGFVHIDIVPWLKEEQVDVPVTINGVDLILKSNQHFPINNVNERENLIEFNDFDNKLLIISRTDSEILWDTDTELFKKYGIEFDKNTKLWTSTIDNNSNKLLVSFPGFGGEKYNYPISTFKAITNYNKLIFADVYGNKGSYLSVDNDGKDLSDRVIKKIAQTIAEFNIAEEDVVFIGISKGASAAIRYGLEFPDAKIEAICPQLNIEHFTRNFVLMNYFLKNSQQKYEVDYDHSNVNLYLAEDDVPSHRKRMFSDYKCNITLLRNYPHIEGGYHAASKVINMYSCDSEIVIDGNGLVVDFCSGSKKLIKVEEPIIYAEVRIIERNLAVSLVQKNNKLVLEKQKCEFEIVDLNNDPSEQMVGEIMFVTEGGIRKKVSNIRIGRLK